jgi:hypothetical protein
MCESRAFLNTRSAEEEIDAAKNVLPEDSPVEIIKEFIGLDEQMIISLKNEE